ncbi:MAG TPA: hypothetical protein VJB15_10010, partial [Rhodothermia bacterium]|nr:hypothetical protein [Rhodothermia bacterium]
MNLRLFSSIISVALVSVGLTACTVSSPRASSSTDASVAERGAPPRVVQSAAGESHFRAVRQITFGGENAEAYFSHDGQWLTLQSTRDGHPCDQQYVMRVDGSGVRRISDGRGKTTCGWFFPGDRRLFFASSMAHDSICPSRPDPSKGYVWPLDRYDMYTINRDGTGLRRLTHNDVYTAEGVL